MHIRTCFGLFLVFWGVVCAEAKPPAPRFAVPALHYSLLPPGGWQRKKDLAAEWTVFLAPVEQEFRANFTVHYAAHAPDAATNAEKFFAEVKKEFAGRGAVHETKQVTLAGKPALAFRVRLHSEGVPDVEVRQICCVFGGHSYTLTFSALAALTKKYDSLCDQVIASFQFDPS